MPARPQATCYPAAALTCQNIRTAAMCTSCNTAAPYSNASRCTSNTANNNGNTNKALCSAYCDTVASCNTVCNTNQAYCSIGQQAIRSHTDVGAIATICTAINEVINKNWTAAYWNELLNDIDTAEIVGRTQAQGAGPGSIVATANAPIQASNYNNVRDKIIRFNTNYAPVAVGDAIKALHPAAINTGYNAANFNTNVCDICNTAGQTQGVCDCNCPCPCDCPCGCDCPCDCDCSCSCTCDCSCSAA